MKRLELLVKIRELGGYKTHGLLKTLLEYAAQSEGKTLTDLEDIEVSDLKNILKVFLSTSKSKLDNNNRKYDQMIKSEENWLNGDIAIKISRNQPLSSGRPRKSWEELGKSSKRAKVAELAQNHPDALAKAAYKTQHTVEIDKRQFVTVKNNNNNDKMPVKMNPAEALSLKI